MERNTVTPTMYNALLDELARLKDQNDAYKQKYPLVGIRWYGAGSFGVKLSSVINGVSYVTLHGYGDKAVIDSSTWKGLMDKDFVTKGVLVRDDSVVDELGVFGVCYQDGFVDNPNSFTSKQIEDILKNKSQKEFEKFINGFTNHFPCRHFLETAKKIGFKDKNKLLVLEELFQYLMTKHNISLLNVHDLNAACESFKINSDNLDTEQKINAVTEKYMVAYSS